MKWGVVIPAGGLVVDPLASALGTPRKALANIHGKPSLLMVLEAVHAAGFDADEIAVVGGPELKPVIGDRAVWVEEEGRQIQNAWLGVEAIPDAEGILFLPCDAPLLTGEGVRAFGEGVFERVKEVKGEWFAAGLCPHPYWDEAFPDWPNPYLRLRDGEFVSGAYYATSRAGFFKGAELFAELSSSRKSQVAMLWKLGIWPMIRYLLHQVTVEEAEDRLGHVFGGQAIIVPDCDPQGMADIDTVEDLEAILKYAKPPRDSAAD